MYIFGKPINNNQNGLKPLRLRQTLNKIHTNVEPRLLKNKQRLQQPSRLTCIYLNPLANFTALDMIFNIRLYTLPKEILLNSMKSFLIPRMTFNGAVMNIL